MKFTDKEIQSIVAEMRTEIFLWRLGWKQVTKKGFRGTSRGDRNVLHSGDNPPKICLLTVCDYVLIK